MEVPYRSLPDFPGLSPALLVRLHHSSNTARTVGILDTGSTFTVFKNGLARQLGIADITVGRITRIRKAGGPFDIYVFDMEAEIFAGTFLWKLSGQIGFASGHLHQNILGLTLVFQEFQIGFRDARQRLYLLPESSP